MNEPKDPPKIPKGAFRIPGGRYAQIMMDDKPVNGRRLHVMTWSYGKPDLVQVAKALIELGSRQ